MRVVIQEIRMIFLDLLKIFLPKEFLSCLCCTMFYHTFF
jgi:hypothetical protein